MANSYTTTELLTSLKRRGLIPSTSETLTTSDFIEIANEELQTFIVPAIISVRQEYFVYVKDTTTTANLGTYPISYRAIGGKVRDVQWYDGSTWVQLEHIEPEREDLNATGGGPAGFKIQNNSIVLLPTPTVSGTLRVKIFQRPSKMVATTDSKVGQITTVTPGSYQLVVASTPTFSTSSNYDIVKAAPGFQCLLADQSASTWSRSGGGPYTWTLTSATYPTELAVGDWLCEPDSSPIPQVPLEFHSILAQRVAGKVLEATGFGAQAGLAFTNADRMLKDAVELIQDRDEAQAPVVINPYGPGQRGLKYRLKT